MNELLNEQLNFEFHSAYIYLGMVAYASSLGLRGRRFTNSPQRVASVGTSILPL